MNRQHHAEYRAVVIEARGLTKDYGDKRAVDDLTFSVEPGIVTGFLGPNGSGEALLALNRGDQLAPWVGFGVLFAYVVAAITVAAVQLARRDV